MNKKAVKIVDKAIAKAKQERDSKGYRENLGYDQFNKVKDQIEKLGVSYKEVCDVMDYFSKECDNI